MFVGQSGVGKSSLVNSLLPEVETRVRPLSELSGQGTHTTTTARPFHFPGGGELIDSPGIREFGLGHVSRADVEAGFIEFNDLLGTCRFRDCKHDREPGCALLKALGRWPRAAATDEQLPFDHRQFAGKRLLNSRVHRPWSNGAVGGRVCCF